MMNRTLYVLSGNAYIHHIDFNTRLLASFCNGFLYGPYGFVNIGNNSANDTIRDSLAHAENLELTIIILLTHNGTDLCSAYI